MRNDITNIYYDLRLYNAYFHNDTSCFSWNPKFVPFLSDTWSVKIKMKIKVSVKLTKLYVNLIPKQNVWEDFVPRRPFQLSYIILTLSLQCLQRICPSILLFRSILSYSCHSDVCIFILLFLNDMRINKLLFSFQYIYKQSRIYL